MPEWEVQCFRNSKLVNGKWEPLQGIEVPVDNGMGISMYQNLWGAGGTEGPEVLYNEATDDTLTRTRKDVEAGKYEHYYSHKTGILVTAFIKNMVGK